jgi:hypothetical protein
MHRIGFLDSPSMSSSMKSGWPTLVGLSLVIGLVACPTSAMARGGFTIEGRPVQPQDANFAGARYASPTYRIPVQINHDTQTAANLELTVVDDVFRALLAQHRREPLLPADSIPVVFIADVKMRRFIEGPRRLLFGSLETELKKQQEVYVSPTAIFLTEVTLADSGRLRAALHLGLGYLFNADFHRAVVGLDHAIPRPAD